MKQPTSASGPRFCLVSLMHHRRCPRWIGILVCRSLEGAHSGDSRAPDFLAAPCAAVNPQSIAGRTLKLGWAGVSSNDIASPADMRLRLCLSAIFSCRAIAERLRREFSSLRALYSIGNRPCFRPKELDHPTCMGLLGPVGNVSGTIPHRICSISRRK
jgi:hypothetical protein